MINDLWYKNAVIYCLSVGTYMAAAAKRDALNNVMLTRNLGAFEIGNRWTIEHAAQGIETRAMTWAIPGFLAGIPAHDAAQMWTDS